MTDSTYFETLAEMTDGLVDRLRAVPTAELDELAVHRITDAYCSLLDAALSLRLCAWSLAGEDADGVAGGEGAAA